MRTSLGIGQGMVMVCKVIAAGGGDGLELVVRELLPKMPPRCRQRVVEYIVRIVHLIDAEHLLEATFIKRAVVGDKRQALDERFNLLPDEGEDGRIFGVFRSQPMHLPAEPLVVLRFRTDQTVEPVNDLSATNDDYANAADAAGTLVGRLEVYRCEISHGQIHFG